jgi:hypothetical protein
MLKMKIQAVSIKDLKTKEYTLDEFKNLPGINKHDVRIICSGGKLETDLVIFQKCRSTLPRFQKT